MTTFLGPNDFDGSFEPQRADAKTGGQSTYHGKVVFTNIDQKIVANALPQGLRLAEKKISATPDLHPIVYLYGHQTKTKWVIRGKNIPVGQDYQELILLIPFVQLVDHENWHNYVVRMYLNDRAARDIGNKFFGYAKHDATFDETATEFTVLVDSRPTFHARIETLGPWQTSTDAERTLPHYRDIQTIFEMPALGMKKVKKNPRFVCSYFEWKYDAAEIAPVQSQHWLLLSGPLTSVPDGAIAIRNLEWRIKSPPLPPCEF